jgi:hypothetical protein
MPDDKSRPANDLAPHGVQSSGLAVGRAVRSDIRVSREALSLSGSGAAVSLALWALLLLAAGPPPSQAQRLVEQTDKAHPRVLYADSLLSVNDRCIVRQGRLSQIFPAVYVNGRPIGFC